MAERLYDIIDAGGNVLNLDGPLEESAARALADEISADGVALARRAAHTMAEQDQFAARYLTAGQQAAYESLCRDLRAGRTPHSGVEAAVAKIVRS